MNQITFDRVLPDVFVNQDISSEVWNCQFNLQRGQNYLIEAASGTGKSSLCSYVFGFRKDFRGVISFDGANIRGLKIADWVNLRKRSLGLLWQDLRLFGELTARENVDLKNRLTHFQKKAQIDQWFERLGIADKQAAKVAQMSFGQQQRVALIRVLCQPLDFLFLDEPVSHLDEQNNRAMAELIAEETARQGAAVVVTSIGKRLEMDYHHILKL